MKKSSATEGQKSHKNRTIYEYPSDSEDHECTRLDSFHFPHGSGDKKLTSRENYERRLSRQKGLQYKFKQSNFLVYQRKHPLYTAM